MAGPYVEAIRRLCMRPAHAGDLPTGQGPLFEAEAGAPERGAWVRFTVCVDEGRVREARFRAWGCPHVLAACELVAGRMAGHPPGLPEGVSGASLARELEVPPEKMGRLLVIEDALAALAAAAATSK